MLYRKSGGGDAWTWHSKEKSESAATLIDWLSILDGSRGPEIPTDSNKIYMLDKE